MEAGTRDPAASREDKGRFGDTSLQTTRQEAETRLAPWGLVEELGNERRIQRLAVRDRGGKQWGQGDTGEMEWERNERHTRQKRVRSALLGWAGWGQQGQRQRVLEQARPVRTMHRSVLQPLDGHQACVLWKQTLNLLGPAV